MFLSLGDLPAVPAAAGDGLSEAICAVLDHDVMQPRLEEAVDRRQIRLHLLSAEAGV